MSVIVIGPTPIPAPLTSEKSLTPPIQLHSLTNHQDMPAHKQTNDASESIDITKEPYGIDRPFLAADPQVAQIALAQDDSKPQAAMVVSDGTRAQRAFWLLCTVLSVAMGIYALQYWGLEFFVPDNIAANKYKTGWLVLHATAAACALFLGPAQFVTSLRRRKPKLHRYMGRAYAFACCTSGGAALVLAVGASTGPVSAVGFFLLGTCWIITTVMGVVQARRWLIPSHRRWMIRSFALALSALTLRIYIPIGIKITGGDFDRAYRGIAWACWVPNLIAAEIYIRMTNK